MLISIQDKNQQKHKVWPQWMWLLMLVYVLALVMANWYDARLIAWGPLITDAGTLVFPITFIAADVLTEVYGYQYTRQAIWIGFAANMIAMLYGQLIILLPSPVHAPLNHIFHQLLNQNLRITIASMISYFLAEPINALLIAKLKCRFEGRWMAARFVSSTVIAAAIDTSVFSLLAFSGVINLDEIIRMIITVWCIKIAIELIGLPFSILVANKLKRIEHIDQYDTTTNFSLFNWTIRY